MPEWSPAATATLRELAPIGPWPLVVDEFNAWARRNPGEPIRSMQSIRMFADRRCIKANSQGDYLLAVELAAMLGRHRKTLRNWASCGLIRPAYLLRFGSASNQPWWFERAGIADLAMRRPELFAGCSYKQILHATRSKAAAAHAVRSNVNRHYHSARPVRCHQLGGTCWPSITSAAKALGLSDRTLSDALLKGRPLGGLQLEYA